MNLLFSRGAVIAALLTATAPAVAAIAPIQARLAAPDGGIFVVAHRGCHNPAPAHGFAGHAPENSLLGLERCVTLGVDMLETDIRRAGDGTLVMFHDATVDRTTDGTGKVAELTWPQLARLRLRDDEGGPDAALTDQHPVTLAQMLAAAKGRIMLNLDVKAPIYAEVVDAVRRAGMERQVVVKTEVGVASQDLASMPPFDQVNFTPVLLNPPGTDDLVQTVRTQTEGKVRPVAIELPRMRLAQLPAVAALAKQRHVRLLVNTLWDGFVADVGGDADAVRDPEAVWGRLYRAGIGAFQTDEPEALLRYRASLEKP
ncbi:MULTISPECIES: glycerophosphodiester phosphodiesterase family protein [Xanthomonas]|uniref:Glycerophosphodiester phosphodiesterase family protein n=1 Tax=Xanthomonas rydalmerensis TaxID=3046274 RepID=A0ABZ0JJ89_9XANT|nr:MULTISPECIES: glycerophosphodiester phosphodiesterase family protein [unclassified Xanthomonas]MBB5876706.1 glycerophosphoryl diester phosphodiesterase [Xanthomonas sp. 3498]MXV06679.1 glycerophosphodiester phosphodiesterase [Xanthomonas sp. LMG 9002]WOS39861.1 glycerophosphodiester phosphodiesterase family protein [Xanthomonas sp. DM-2023]WOS44045.1 glycerophosphodiester phosphodiesterase family protein [Xanthomonas sp. DM-2023]WOS48225.1 glycerophosphodiester phosphodiesterase family prot